MNESIPFGKYESIMEDGIYFINKEMKSGELMSLITNSPSSQESIIVNRVDNELKKQGMKVKPNSCIVNKIDESLIVFNGVTKDNKLIKISYGINYNESNNDNISISVEK